VNDRRGRQRFSKSLLCWDWTFAAGPPPTSIHHVRTYRCGLKKDLP
jgi:hypothetical protein